MSSCVGGLPIPLREGRVCGCDCARVCDGDGRCTCCCAFVGGLDCVCVCAVTNATPAITAITTTKILY